MESSIVFVVLVFVIWFVVTNNEQRRTMLGYAIAFAVLMSIIALFTGQGPGHAY